MVRLPPVAGSAPPPQCGHPPAHLVAVSGFGQGAGRAPAAGFDVHLADPLDVDDLDRFLAGSPIAP